MSATITFYEEYNYLLRAIEPLHVGSGSGVFGRVDLPVVRDSATNLPYVPATAIKGVLRHFSAYTTALKKQDADVLMCADVRKISKRHDSVEKHPFKCEICLAYGYVCEKIKPRNFAGILHFTDAHILLFPIPSAVKCPLFITSDHMLTLFLQEICNWQGELLLTQECLPLFQYDKNMINIGRYILNTEKNEIRNEIIDLLKTIKCTLCGFGNENKRELNLDKLLDRICVVKSDLFPRIINNHMDFRTSIAIDPITGAAKTGALYTYEALPRETILWFKVYLRRMTRPMLEELLEDTKEKRNDIVNSAVRILGIESNTGKNIITLMEQASELMSVFGIGGIVTRGFGRVCMYRISHSTSK